jgi:hypothetical protein
MVKDYYLNSGKKLYDIQNCLTGRMEYDSRKKK